VFGTFAFTSNSVLLDYMLIKGDTFITTSIDNVDLNLLFFLQNKPSLLSSLMMWIQLSLLCGFQPCAGRWRSLALLKERIALDKYVFINWAWWFDQRLSEMNAETLQIMVRRLFTRRLDPIELVVWLPALCRKMEVPYCLFTHYNASMPDRHLWLGVVKGLEID